MEVERALGTLDATHKVPRNPGLPRGYARKISGTTALQEALKEKQQHIEQLLAERDLERAEVAKATSHVGEIEQELALARDGHDQVKSGPDLVVEMVMGSRLILSRRR